MKVKFHYIQDSTIIGFDPSIGAVSVSNSLGIMVPLVISPGFILQCPLSSMTAPANVSITSGSPADFTVTPAGPGPYNLQWQVSSNNGVTWTNLANTPPYTGVNSNQLHIDSVYLALNQNQYRCIETGPCPYNSTAASLTVQSPVIGGTVTYSNAVSTPMGNCPVSLKQGSTVVRQTITNVAGEYSFQDIPFGNYTIEATTTKPWGGGSSVDALTIIKHYAGLITLSGMPLQAADVNGDAAINTADALLVAKRFVNMITSFPASDWIIETPAVTATNPILYNVNLKAICRGDVNGSYVP
jgi:hypothetical protein